MDFLLDEKQNIVRRSVRSFCEREIQPIAKGYRHEARFRGKWWKKWASLDTSVSRRRRAGRTCHGYSHLLYY
jgi:hypothetical protein